MMMTNRWRLTKTFVFLTLCAPISAPVRSETLDHLQTLVYLSCSRTTFSLHKSETETLTEGVRMFDFIETLPLLPQYNTLSPFPMKMHRKFGLAPLIF